MFAEVCIIIILVTVVTNSWHLVRLRVDVERLLAACTKQGKDAAND